jgi:hypothetical protein
MNERLPKFKCENLLTEIKKSTAGLTYISETDAAVETYNGGHVDSVNISHFVPNKTGSGKYEQISPERFFERLTTERDWYGPREKEIARRFAELEKLLRENLSDLTVFRIGRIQIDIYVVGLDAEDNLIGIKTKAVET